jgi:hypothetical protein
MLKFLTLAALLLPAALALAQPALVTIEDPAGDDNGSGTLIYPQRSDLQPGDLDLRALRIFRESGGMRFEATFQNAIRDPATVVNEVGGNEALSVFARRGFYAFNIDIYIDIDRVAGSGNLATLPGRRASIDPAHAWEKAIVLTPRPEVMRRQFQEALTEAAGKGVGDLGPTIDRSVFFPTEVRVRGKTVSFFVPDSFLGSTAAADWSMSAFVTGAKINIETDFRLFGASNTPVLQRLALGALQPAEGRPSDTFGYRGDTAPATSIVDLLGPGGLQSRQLASGTLEGVDRNTRAVASAPAPAAAATPAPAAPAGGGSVFSRALDAVNRALGFGGSAAPAAPAAAAAVTPSLQSLLQPGSVPAAAAAAPAVVVPAAATVPAAVLPAAAPTARPAPAADSGKPKDAAFFEEQELRLRTLKRLRDSGLITEQEYQQKRKDVLDRL